MDEITKLSLKQRFSKIHDHLYANSSITRNERLGQEFIKVILTKHFDEKWEENLFDSSNYKDYSVEFPHRFQEFFSNRVFPALVEKGVFSKRDKLMLDRKSLEYLGKELEDINFSENPIDSLGAAFEVFSEGNLAGDSGQFFTPLYMIRMCVQTIGVSKNLKILDPACGSGGFLNYSVRWLNEKEMIDNNIQDNIIGIDKDLDLIRIAKSFALFMDIEPDHFYRLNSLKILSEDNRLKEFEFRKKYLGEIDLIVTNPPFGTKIKITDSEILQYYDLGHVWSYNTSNKRWKKSRTIQETEPQILFIELCIKLLKEGGRMAIVLPEGIFGNPGSEYIRDYILSKGKILGVFDCPQVSFMPHTNTKTSILLFEKDFNYVDNEIFFGTVNYCGYDSRGAIVQTKDGNVKEDYNEVIRQYNAHSKGISISNNNCLTVHKSKLNKAILIPSYYSEHILGEGKKDSKDIEEISLGELEKMGAITIRNVPATLSKHEYGSGNFPFIRTTDIGNGEVLYPTIHKISEEVLNKYRDKQGLKEFDILFVKDGTYRIGKTAMLFKSDLNSLVQSHFKFIRVYKNDYLDEFLLFHLLQKKTVQKQIQNNIFTQATLSTIGNRIKDIKISLPKNKNERERISKLIKDHLLKRNESRLKIFVDENV